MIGVLGFFDGLHLGHKKIISFAKNIREKDEKVVAFIFYPHPSKPAPYINTINERKQKLILYGVDRIVVLNLKKYFRMMPEEFLNLFFSKYKLKKIVVGEDFRFGYKRRGNLKLLKRLSAEKDIKVYPVEILKFKGEKVSSASLKKFLKEGKLKLFKELTGYNYSFKGKIVRGRGIGRKKIFPTINLKVNENKFLPEGVFFVLVEDKYYGAADIGYSPTVKKLKKKLIEIYFLNLDEEILKRKFLKIELLKFIRKEKKFKDIGELKKAIEKDIHKSLILMRKIDKR